MTTTPQEILERAAYIIESNGWTRGAYGRKLNGESVPATSPDACRFCAIGAIRLAAFELLGKTSQRMARESVGVLHETICADVADWNDNHAPSGYYVVAKMREAAELID